jgi:hypothetical protein
MSRSPNRPTAISPGHSRPRPIDPGAPTTERPGHRAVAASRLGSMRKAAHPSSPRSAPAKAPRNETPYGDGHACAHRLALTYRPPAATARTPTVTSGIGTGRPRPEVAAGSRVAPAAGTGGGIKWTFGPRKPCRPRVTIVTRLRGGLTGGRVVGGPTPCVSPASRASPAPTAWFVSFDASCAAGPLHATRALGDVTERHPASVWAPTSSRPPPSPGRSSDSCSLRHPDTRPTVWRGPRR